jgi:hypothetical protein
MTVAVPATAEASRQETSPLGEVFAACVRRETSPQGEASP